MNIVHYRKRSFIVVELKNKMGFGTISIGAKFINGHFQLEVLLFVVLRVNFYL